MVNFPPSYFYPDDDPNLPMVPMTDDDFEDYQIYDVSAETIVEMNSGDMRGLYILRAEGEKVPLFNLYVHNQRRVRMEGDRRIYDHPGAQADWDYRSSIDLLRANNLLDDLAPGDSLHALMFPAHMMWKIVFVKNADDTITMYGFKISEPDQAEDESDDDYEPFQCYHPDCHCVNPDCHCHQDHY